jgi:hypothetical protein
MIACFRCQAIAELLLFLLLPKEDFRSLGLRTLVRELLVNMVLKPVLDLISDPDYLNQCLVWLYQDTCHPELFTLTLQYSESMAELTSTREAVTSEISRLRSLNAKVPLNLSRFSFVIYVRWCQSRVMYINSFAGRTGFVSQEPTQRPSSAKARHRQPYPSSAERRRTLVRGGRNGR